MFAKIASALTPLLALTASSLLVLTNAAHAQDYAPADTSAPYYDNEKNTFELPKDEYADLQAYLEKARETLNRTLKDARSLAGTALHDRLLSGAKDAVKQSGFDYKFMLFRHVLERAIDIDTIYLGGTLMLAPDKLEERYDAASLVLLTNIRVAIKYYEYGRTDLSQEVIPVPDWIAFASDMIPLLQSHIKFAPNAGAQKSIAIRALGWTARSLNTSLQRKELGQQIVDVMDTQARLKKGEIPVAAAQQQLLEVAKVLETLSKRKAEVDSSRNEEEPSKTASAYPVAGNSGEVVNGKVKTGLFPLIDTDMGGPIGYDGKTSLSLAIAAGYGGIVEAETDRQITGYSQLNARATLLLKQLSNLSGDRKRFDNKTSFAAATELLDVRARFAPAQAPIYRLKATAAASLIVVGGVFAAVEADRYRSVASQIARLGWGPMATIHIDGNEYVMIRGGVGTNAMNIESQQRVTTHGSDGDVRTRDHSFKSHLADGLSYELSTIIRIASFVVDLEVNMDNFSPNRETDPSAPPKRLKGAAEVTIPLGLIFGNDAIKIEGEAAHYKFSDPAFKNQSAFAAGATYTVQW